MVSATCLSVQGGPRGTQELHSLDCVLPQGPLSLMAPLSNPRFWGGVPLGSFLASETPLTEREWGSAAQPCLLIVSRNGALGG